MPVACWWVMLALSTRPTAILAMVMIYDGMLAIGDADDDGVVLLTVLMTTKTTMTTALSTATIAPMVTDPKIDQAPNGPGRDFIREEAGPSRASRARPGTRCPKPHQPFVSLPYLYKEKNARGLYPEPMPLPESVSGLVSAGAGRWRSSGRTSGSVGPWQV